MQNKPTLYHCCVCGKKISRVNLRKKPVIPDELTCQSHNYLKTKKNMETYNEVKRLNNS